MRNPAAEPRISLGVFDRRVRGLVRAAIRFDDSFPRKTNEILEIGPDRRLPAKAIPVDLMISQLAPKHGFRSRHVATLRTHELARGLTKTQGIVHPRHISQSRRRSLPQLGRGRWCGAPVGVWPAAATQAGLHDRRCELASSHPCFPHPIRPFGPPSPLRGEGGERSDRPLLRPTARSAKERDHNSSLPPPFKMAVACFASAMDGSIWTRAAISDSPPWRARRCGRNSFRRHPLSPA
jgi:hypothetical protein